MIRAIGLGLAVGAMLAGGFWVGYRWQAGNVAEAKAEQAKAETARDRYRANVEIYQSAIEAQKAANETALAEADAQKAKADKAVANSKIERDRYDRRLAEILAGVEKDKLDPKCKA